MSTGKSGIGFLFIRRWSTSWEKRGTTYVPDIRPLALAGGNTLLIQMGAAEDALRTVAITRSVADMRHTCSLFAKVRAQVGVSLCGCRLIQFLLLFGSTCLETRELGGHCSGSRWHMKGIKPVASLLCRRVRYLTYRRPCRVTFCCLFSRRLTF